LKSNVQNVAQRKEFEVQQANIFAFELEELYAPYKKEASDSRLDIAGELLNVL